MAAKPLASRESAAGRLFADRIIDELGRAEMNTPGIRAVRRRFSKELKGTDRKTVLACAHELIRRAPYGRFVAYELVHFHDATLRSLTEAEVEKLGQGIQSWGDVDTFACYISGPAWHVGCVRDETIARWTRSEEGWWRRAALVSTVPLNSRERAARRSSARTLAVCRRLMEDREDLVVKAMSWALRAMGRRDPDGARKFLASNRHRLAARVIRELENKLNTGVKSPRKARPVA